MTKSTWYPDPDLARDLAVAAAEDRRSQTDCITEAVREWLKRRAEKR